MQQSYLMNFGRFTLGMRISHSDTLEKHESPVGWKQD